MKKTLIYGLILICLFGFNACRTDKTEKEDERYVVLSPEVAEILAALGLEARIVGLTQECSYPPSLEEIPKIGSFGAVKLESVLALKPSMVFASSLEQEAISIDLKRLGVRVESIYPKSIAEIFSEIERIGELTGTEEKARSLVKEMQAELREIKANAAGKSVPKVYLEIYRDPLMSVADNSFVAELLEFAGGDNVFDTLERDYSRVNPENVIEAMPDIMIVYSRDSLQNIRSRKGWQVIPAIESGMIFFEDDIDPDLIQRAGPRILQGLRELQRIYEVWRKQAA